MNDKYIAQAPTKEEAIQKGLAALNLTEDEAMITVEEPGKKGFLGIGQKDAVVIVERKEKVDLVADLLDKDRPPRREPKEKSAPVSETQPEPTEEESVLIEEKEIVPEFGKSEEDLEIEDTDPDLEENTVSEEENIPTEISEAEQDQVAIDDIAQYLEDIIHGMGVLDAKVYTSRVENRVTYDVETEDAGLVIGRHGKVLNGLQTLAQNHMHQLAFNKLLVKVDAEKYRSRRHDTVEHIARKTADKVIKTGRPVALNPMPAHERKQIHRYLNDYPEVTTHSEGKEPHRYLVVELAK